PRRRGAAGEALQAGFGHAVLQHRASDGLRLVFQVAAADGVVQALAADDHLRAGITRRRATLLNDGHQHAGFALLLQLGECVDPDRVAHVQSSQLEDREASSTNTFVLRQWWTSGALSTLRQAGVVSVAVGAAACCFSLRICSTPQSTRSGVAGASIFGCTL